MDNPYNEKFNRLCDKLARDLVDRGLLIRAGSKAILSLGLPADRTEALRYAFFAGAEHVFSTMFRIMDDGREPTLNDLARMSKIHDELEAWRKTALAVLESSPRGHG
jgi:hypothetical protein